MSRDAVLQIVIVLNACSTGLPLCFRRTTLTSRTQAVILTVWVAIVALVMAYFYWTHPDVRSDLFGAFTVALIFIAFFGVMPRAMEAIGRWRSR